MLIRRGLVIVLAAAVLAAMLAARPRPTRPPVHLPVNGPTYSNEISRIFQQNCDGCHHDGDIAPFSLMTYAATVSHAADIKYMTQTHQMPPWKAAASCGVFSNARLLSQSDIDLIGKWVDNGAPEGNRADLPTPLDFTSGWKLGPPDLVLSYPEGYTPPAKGDMYRCFTIPTNLVSDQYVAAVDFHPGDRQTVHHVIAFVDTNGQSAQLDDKDAGPGYTCFGGPSFADPGMLGGWAPGAQPVKFADNVALQLAGNSRVVLQVHYHPHGTQLKADRTEIGIYFSKTKPTKIVRIFPLINDTFTIPPNDSNYEVVGGLPLNIPALPVGVHVWGVWPHMHLLGKNMKVEATLPNGKTECLVNIDDWDFNWQGMYQYKDAIALPALTKLKATAHYDNSTDNWRNPNNPPKPVSWGEETTDEMCLAFLALTIDSENVAANQVADTRWIPPLFGQVRHR